MTGADFALWLYGSWARGNVDGDSDVDLLLVSDLHIEQELEQRLVRLTAHFGVSPIALSVSHYTWREIEEMVAYGSLFMHHLLLEGQVIEETEQVKGRLNSLLTLLGPFVKARLSLAGFRATVADVEDSMSHGGSPAFELSVLATVFRHASILAGYVSGRPTYGRVAALLVGASELGFDARFAERLAGLYRFRMHECRGYPLPYAPSVLEVEEWRQLARRFLDALEERIDEYDRRIAKTVEAS